MRYGQAKAQQPVGGADKQRVVFEQGNQPQIEGQARDQQRPAVLPAGAAPLDLPADDEIDQGRAAQQRQEIRPPPGIEGVGGQQQEQPPPGRRAFFQQPEPHHRQGQKNEIRIGIEGHAASPRRLPYRGKGASRLLEQNKNNVMGDKSPLPWRGPMALV